MKFLWLPFIISIGLLAYRMDARATEQKKDDGSWTTEFAVEKGELSATGRNPYFILEPGYQLAFEGGKERLAITVLGSSLMRRGISQ